MVRIDIPSATCTAATLFEVSDLKDIELSGGRIYLLIDTDMIGRSPELQLVELDSVTLTEQRRTRIDQEDYIDDLSISANLEWALKNPLPSGE